MLEALTIPPRMVVRALDDLHTLADGLRRLTERQGDLEDLLSAVRALPEVEHRLSERIDELETQAARIVTKLDDMDDTAEALEKSLGAVEKTIGAFHGELRDLRDKIPGI